jgi:hypothetical protein
MSFHRNADEKIKQALARGEFDNLPGKGKPLDLDAYFATPEHLRMGGDCFGDFALDHEDVDELTVVGFGPEVGIGLGVKQLNIDPHLIARFLHATLKNVRYSKLLRDLGEIARFALKPLRGRA